MAAIVTFNYAQFIERFPEYSDTTLYSQSILQGWWDIAIFYVSNIANCGTVQDDKRQYAIELMMAHLIFLSLLIAGGQVPGLVDAATIDKISVTLVKPPETNQWQWWLNISPYGQQLLALLQVNSVGGYYIGGAPIQAGFRSNYFRRGRSCC